MPQYEYHTVDVFTDRRFGGNPLAVFPAAEGIDAATMQALAAELNYSETTFVLPPETPGNTARVRIFNRTSEMPFAGHPNVGTAFVLARLGTTSARTMRFEELAGVVEVRLIEGPDGVSGAEIDAPQPLSLREVLPVDGIAKCLGLTPGEITTERHSPVRASVGVDFILVEIEPEALANATPNLAAYRELVAHRPAFDGRLSIFAYTLEGEGVRARMFAPLAGTWEDPATGSANAALAALRLKLLGGDGIRYEATQGVEMGRPSRLSLCAWRHGGAIHASVGGHCVEVFRGAFNLRMG